MEGDRLSTQNETRLPAACRSLVETGWLLFNGVQPVDQRLIDDLQLLLVGAQLRGQQLRRLLRPVEFTEQQEVALPRQLAEGFSYMVG